MPSIEGMRADLRLRAVAVVDGLGLSFSEKRPAWEIQLWRGTAVFMAGHPCRGQVRGCSSCCQAGGDVRGGPVAEDGARGDAEMGGDVGVRVPSCRQGRDDSKTLCPVQVDAGCGLVHGPLHRDRVQGGLVASTPHV